MDLSKIWEFFGFDGLRVCIVNTHPNGWRIYRCKYRGKIESYIMKEEGRVYKYPGMKKVSQMEGNRFMNGYYEWIDDIERGREREEYKGG